MSIIIGNTYQAVGLINNEPVLARVPDTGALAEIIAKSVLVAGVGPDGQTRIIRLTASGGLLS